MKFAPHLIALTLVAAAAPLPAQTSVTKAPFGKMADGKLVDLYTLKDKSLTVKVITYGAHIISIDAPDRNGKQADVVLGYDNLDKPSGYVADTTYMGSVVGRYGNRIDHSRFTLDGKTYNIDKNEKGYDTLHGGKVGFSRLNWTGKEIPGGVELTLVSPDGDMGFPGTLTAHVRYTLEGDKIKIAYTATTDKPTVINLTNHSYFTLARSGTVLDQILQINADKYTPVDEHSIPLGQLAPVAGTPFDFRKPTVIGSRINDNNEQLKIGHGYDHNFVLNPPHTLDHPAVILSDPKSGRVLTVYTTEPGVQVYTGNFLDGTFTGVNGEKYVKNDGICFETQHYPDSPNHPAFPTTTLNPGQTYRTTTIFQFTAK
jgi:aldose 1-epimerase